MNENATKRRAWVKNAIIIFLAVMLILTFFSNTIMNYSLPEVAAQYSQSGSITSKIRTSAVAKANSTSKIKIDESRKVRAVAVKDGEMVEVGDVLFYLEDEESSQLKSARENLAQLERQYQLKMLESGKDYYADELSIKNKRDELNKAREELGNVANKEATIAALDAQIKQLNEDIKQLNADQKELTKTISNYDKQISNLRGQAADASLDGIPTATRIAEAIEKLNTAQAAYNAAELLKAQTAAALEAAEDAYEKANSEYEALSPDGSSSAASLTEQINRLNKTIRRYKEDYDLQIAGYDKEIDDAYDAYVDADYAYNNALYLYNQGLGSLEAVERWQLKTDEAKAAYDAAVANNKPKKEAAKRTYDRQMEDYNEDLEKLENQLANIGGTEKAREKLNTATKNKKSATEAATKASEDFDKSKTELTQSKTDLKALERLQQLEDCESIRDGLSLQSEGITEQVEGINEQISDINKKKTEISGGATTVEAQQEIIDRLSQELETLVHNLNKRKEEDNLQAQRDQLELGDLIKKIEEAKETVRKCEENSVDAKILATVAGQVSSISATAGSETSVGQTLCEIIATDLGYSCEINLTIEQSKRVRVGDSVTISNNWWSNIKGTITALRNDPQNPGSSRIATISLTGDVTQGQSLNLTIGESGQTYDAVVPNSAIREDNNGKFVLVVEAKSSPLGNRYIAKRCDVNVLASDDTNSAVSGLIGSEFIITTSTKPIANGDQVRMVENSK